MPDQHRNFAVSLVATAPSPATSGTSLVVTAGHGTRFPAVPFNATVWPAGAAPDPSNAEIVRVTVVSTDTLTITRAQESTTARSIVVGDQIAATITAKTLTDAELGTVHNLNSPGAGDGANGDWSLEPTPGNTSGRGYRQLRGPKASGAWPAWDGSGSTADVGVPLPRRPVIAKYASVYDPYSAVPAVAPPAPTSAVVIIPDSGFSATSLADCFSNTGNVADSGTGTLKASTTAIGYATLRNHYPGWDAATVPILQQTKAVISTLPTEAAGKAGVGIATYAKSYPSTANFQGFLAWVDKDGAVSVGVRSDTTLTTLATSAASTFAAGDTLCITRSGYIIQVRAFRTSTGLELAGARYDVDMNLTNTQSWGSSNGSAVWFLDTTAARISQMTGLI